MRGLFLFLIVVMSGIAAQAADSTFDSTHKSWNVFTSGSGAEKVCYATSTPTKETGTFKQRGEPYVLVTARNGGAVEISISSGYPYKENSLVEVSVDKKQTFKLFTTSETPQIAWARSGEDDKKIAGAFKKGGNITIKGTSQKGTSSTDSYSLSGFGTAYGRIMELCK